MVFRRLLIPLVLFLLIAGMAALFLRVDPAQQIGSELRAAPAGMASPPALQLAADAAPSEAVEAESAADCRMPVEPGEADRRIAVSVATLWKKPGLARAKDVNSLTNPVQVADWLEPLTIKEKLWFVGKLETQALLGTEVRVLEEQGDWVKVVVPEQSTSLREDGYPGWLPAVQLAEKLNSYEACQQMIVTKPTTGLYASPASDTAPELEVSFATQLPVLQEQDAWLEVDTPLGAYWIERDSVRHLPSSETVSGEALVEAGMTFLDLPYLWAGTSGYGFDCSGFTYSLHRLHGLLIPRDAKDQAAAGVPVAREELQPGDLLFFAYEKGKGKVHHVGMYIGDGRMLHSPKTERAVEIIRLDTPEYAVEYAGARRYY
jgi:gamma-D-glutamyl-L-lysine dipeptidyl-peptidase